MLNYRIDEDEKIPNYQITGAIQPFRPAIILVFAAFGNIFLVIGVVALACYMNYHCRTIPTLSYATNADPMRSLYRIGVTIFVMLTIPIFVSMYVYFKAKLTLIRPVPNHIRCLNRLNSVFLTTGLLSSFTLFLQSLVNQHGNEPYHSILSFSYLGFDGVSMCLSMVLLYYTRITRSDYFWFRMRKIMVGVICLVGLVTVIEALLAYRPWLRGNKFINETVLAYCELSTVTLACLFLVPFYREMSCVTWNVVFSFPPTPSEALIFQTKPTD